MKNYGKKTALFLAAGLLAAGCGQGKNVDGAGESQVSVYSAPEVSVSVEEVSPEGAVLTVQNSGPVISGSSPYYIQYQEDDSWNWAEYLDPEGERAWTEPLYEIEKEFQLELDWKEMYGSLEPGRYRVLYPCTVEGQDEQVYLAAEFQIEEKQ